MTDLERITKHADGWLAASPMARSRKLPRICRRMRSAQVPNTRHRDLHLPRLRRLIAQQTSTLVGRTARGEQLGLAPTTARSYLNLLTHVYFVHEELIPLSHLHDQAVGTQPIRHATTWKHQKTFLK